MIFSQPLPLVASRVSQHDFVLDALSPGPSAGLPLGNGDLSASLYGGPGHLSLRVVKGEVSAGTIILRVPDHESRAKSHESKNFGPATVLRLYDATARVALSDGIEVETFVAATRSLIVLRVRSQRAAPLPAALELSPNYEVRSATPPQPSPRAGRELSSPRSRGDKRGVRYSTFDLRPSTFDCDGPFRYLRQDLSAGLSAILCGLVYGARSHAVLREDALLATFDAPPSGECLVLIGVATSQDGPDPARSARAEVERALPHGYLLLQREHAVFWERSWSQIEGSEHINYRQIYGSKIASRDP